MIVIIKVLTTALVILMSMLFISDIVKHFKGKRYAYVFLGIVLTAYMVYCWCKTLML